MKKLIIATLIAAASLTANAQNAGVYVGTDLFSNRLSGFGRTTGLGVFGGYSFGNGAAVELSANRIGRYDIAGFTTSFNDFSLSGLYGVQLNKSLSVYGRLGYGTVRASDKTRLASRGVKLDNGLTYGLGVDYAINNNFGLRGEFRKPARDLNSFGLGIYYKF